MTTAAASWQDLFRDQRHALLGLQARALLKPEARSLADDEVLLLGGASEAARLSKRPGAVEKKPLSVALTPEKEQSLEDFQKLVAQMRQAYPEAELAGYGPLTAPPRDRFQGLDRGIVMAGKASLGFEISSDMTRLEGVTLPLTAVLVYTPQVTPHALERAAKALGEVLTLVGVVPLPAGAGDRIPLAGLTTAGSLDAMVISALRILLPPEISVRASWAALGWKVAQVALAYGADEVAGWTGAETLAYTGRVRAASRVERQELDEGLQEARRRDLAWPKHSLGGAL